LVKIYFLESIDTKNLLKYSNENEVDVLDYLTILVFCRQRGLLGQYCKPGSGNINLRTRC